MISNKLLQLATIATKMELLLPKATRQYRAMYATLEHDLDIALEGIAMRMIEKYNIPTQHPSDGVSYEIPTDLAIDLEDDNDPTS